VWLKQMFDSANGRPTRPNLVIAGRYGEGHLTIRLPTFVIEVRSTTQRRGRTIASIVTT